MFPFSWRTSYASVQICKSLRLLFRGTGRPFTHLLELLWVWPWKLRVPAHFRSPRSLRDAPDTVWERYDGMTVLRQIPLFIWRDTPTRSLYRMYEYLCADLSDQLMLEFNYFWSHPYPDRWTPEAIADPCDEDLERYAVLASLVESLVNAFNFRRSYGFCRSDALPGHDKEGPDLMVGPSWTAKVPPLPSRLSLYEPVFPPLPNKKEPFAGRNIVANAGNLFSV